MSKRPAFLMGPAIDRLGKQIGKANPAYAVGADIGNACVNLAEMRCLRRIGARAPKAKVVRSGWPDFLVVDEGGKTYGIEVKSGEDVVSKVQARTFTILESIGIPVYVWRNSKPDVLTPWKKDKPNLARLLPQTKPSG